MNSIKILNNDVYFLEILEDILIINDNYSGLICYNNNLEQISKLELPEDLLIYSSFKNGKKILLFCPDNNCFIYFNLNSNESKIITLEKFKNVIFSPLYIWTQNNIILSDYIGNFFELDLNNFEIDTISKKNKAYKKIIQEFEKLKELNIYRLYENKKKALVYFQDAKLRLIDYSKDIKVIYEFEKEDFNEFDCIVEYITKISENKVEIVHNCDKNIYYPEKNYMFLRGKIMDINETWDFFMLSAMKSNLQNCKIEKIKLI